MIIVHDTFRIRFGAAREVRALLEEGRAAMPSDINLGNLRALWNFTGPNYTVVMELTFDSLASMEEVMKKTIADPKWQEWYRKLVPYIEEGHRTIYTD